MIQEAWYFPAEDSEPQSGPKDPTLSRAAMILGEKKTLLDLALILWKEGQKDTSFHPQEE